MKSLFLSLFLTFSSLHSASSKTLISNTMIELTEDTVLLRGQIQKKQFKNKALREIKGVYDLFFKCGDESYFIKIRDGKVQRKELEKYLNKNIQLKVILREGTWDTSEGDPPAQSRIGKYVVVLEIIE